MRLPRVIGHRGAAKRAPENTLAGLRKAAELGVSWVEFDVRLTADDVLVLLHDEKLGRTTNGSGRVRRKKLDEIRALDAGSWFGGAFAGEPVPTLEDALNQVRRLGLRANIEIKSDTGDEQAAGEAVVQMVRSVWPRDREPPLISAFNQGCMDAVAAAAPELPLALLIEFRRPEWRRRRTAHHWRTIHCDHQFLTRKRVEELKKAELPLAAYTVNTARRAQALFDYGVDAVFSDCPDVLKAVL